MIDRTEYHLDHCSEMSYLRPYISCHICGELMAVGDQVLVSIDGDTWICSHHCAEVAEYQKGELIAHEIELEDCEDHGDDYWLAV